MKKKTIFLLLGLALFAHFRVMAQWNLAGNAGTNPPVDFLGTTDNKGLVFKTNNTERMRITVGGKVGIGTLNPQAGAHINVAAGQNPLRVDVNGAAKFFVHSNGGVSVGSNTAPLADGLFVSGNIEAAGGEVNMGSVETLADAGSFVISSNSDFIPDATDTRDLGTAANEWRDLYLAGNVLFASDARLKTNIRELDYGLKEIMQLRTVRYNLRDGSDKGDKLGVIAQEIQKILPQVVVDKAFKQNEHTGISEKVPSDHLSVKYIELIPVLIHAIQQQQSVITNLEQRLGRMEKTPTKTDAALKEVRLEQNEPNPFNQVTTIRYRVPESVHAQIIVYDASGNLVKSMPALANGRVQINGHELKAGNYTYNLVVNGKSVSARKMMLVK